MALALCPLGAQGQTAPDVAGAAAAFDEGQRAQLARDFARAAEMFELADRAAPSAAALRSAIRNHQAAGHLARAATLALRARTRDAADAASAALATEVLEAQGPRLTRLAVRCDPACGLLLDGRAAGALAAREHELFVEPGARNLEVSWAARGSRSLALEAVAGTRETLRLEAPAEAPVPAVTPPPTPPSLPAPRAPEGAPLPSGDRGRGSWSPVVFGVLGGATVIAGAVLTWSAVDTLGARDTYVAAPTEAGYRDGVARETRTNALVAVTATLGAATLVSALLTDWNRARRPPTAVAAMPLDGGALLSVLASF